MSHQTQNVRFGGYPQYHTNLAQTSEAFTSAVREVNALIDQLNEILLVHPEWIAQEDKELERDDDSDFMWEE